MKKSLIVTSLLLTSSLFAGEVYNSITTGGYKANSDSIKGYISLDGEYIQDALRIPGLLDMKNKNGFWSNEKYTIGDSLSNVEFQFFYKNVGLTTGYLDINHNHLDGAYAGITYSDSLFGLSNGAIANYIYDTNISLTIAPFTNNDIDLVTKFEITQNISKNIIIGANYTLISDNRKVSEQNGGGWVNQPTNEKQYSDTKITSLFVKIPF